MQKKRWYSTAEPLADGSIVLIGGMVGGGYINRNTPDTTPVPEAAENSHEFCPSRSPATPLPFLYKTGGLIVYAHAFLRLLNSGKMLVQANVSTMIWDYNANTEVDLPDMPGNVVRVYPASGAVAMLPLTPANNYNLTILFCGDNDMPEPSWVAICRRKINLWIKGMVKTEDLPQILPVIRMTNRRKEDPQDGRRSRRSVTISQPAK
ncbi:putative copper radical oxidase [Lyophyllum shimeji]|uniref:Copper radical oxidase n=1 Tax=Lyophyllum shimeji TaxID=47721 RepID=A0A9P3PRP9_LYOSH|nr:putative copper radical oxidase [Lyophyllum shimeji]